jgi:hypothetical protein
MVCSKYFTAERMLHASALSDQRHKAVFGVWATDMQKCVKPMGW